MTRLKLHRGKHSIIVPAPIGKGERPPRRLSAGWFRPGEVSEWLKEHAWKACIRKRIEGSNPSLSAIL